MEQNLKTQGLRAKQKEDGVGKRKDGCLSCDSEGLRDEEGLTGASWQDLL